MNYITKEIKTFEYDNSIFNALEREEDIYEQENKYVKEKLGKDYLVTPFTTPLRRKIPCPYCEHKFGKIIELYYSQDKTRRIVYVECTRCVWRHLIYQESDLE